MAQIALGLAGAVIGAYIGGPAGALTGFSLGYTLGGIVDPTITHRTGEGPRLNDLAVSASAYGTVRNIVYGTARVNGNIIWAKPIREQKTSKREQSGKGMGGQVNTTITYSYFGTFALALCEGPVMNVLRIWGDGKLIYDVSATTEAVLSPGLNFRFYPGDESQLPDSLIEADKGVGQVPAFRGTCYMVFNDIPLADYGNRLPSITVEVAATSDDTHTDQPLTTFPSGYAFGGIDYGPVAIDAARGFLYLAGNTPHGLLRADLNTMVQDRQAVSTALTLDLSDLQFTELLAIPDGTVFAASFSAISRIDGPTLAETNRASAFDTIHAFAIPSKLAYIEVDTDFGNHYFVVAGGLFNEVAVYYAADLTPLTPPGSSTRDGNYTYGICRGQVTAAFGDAWTISGYIYAAHDPVYISRIQVMDTYNQVADSVSEAARVSIETEATIHAADILPGATGFFGALTTPVYDDSDDSIIFTAWIIPATGSYQWWVVKWSNGTFLWKTPVPFGGGTSGSLIGGTIFQMMSGVELVQLDAVTGTIIYDSAWTDGSSVTFFLNGGYVAIGNTRQVIAHTGGLGWTKLFVNRPTGNGVTLGSIIADMCLRSGLASSDIDTSDATQSVLGFVVSQKSAASQLVQSLAQTYLLNCVERDDRLFFENRGKGVKATIPQSDLIRLNAQDAEPYKEVRKQEVDLPYRVTLTTMDLAKDYQTNVQSATRPRRPDPTMFSDNQTDLQLTAVMDQSQAKQQVEKLLFTAWLNRRSFQLRLPSKYIYLDAADSIALELANGDVIQGRMTNGDIGADYALDTTIEAESYGTYSSSATGAAGDGFDGQTVKRVVPSAYYLLDTPLLRDIDENSLALRVYWAAGPFSEVAWSGCELDKSPDGQVWSVVDTSLAEMDWGHIFAPPADPASCFHTQTTGTMDVVMSVGGGTLASISDDSLANGFNAMVVLKQNGEVEILQFRDVTVLGNGQYRLSWLNRGRRGTDTMANGLQVGDAFILLSSATVLPIQIPIASRNVPLVWRGVSINQLPENAQAESFTFIGRDKMPYAPVHVTAALVGSDVHLAWVRRTRLGGDLLGGTGTVPINEQSEAYEVDILSGVGGTVKRTLTGLTSAAAVYTAAEITTDFGTPPAHLSVRVYQISTIVGRGFGREDPRGDHLMTTTPLWSIPEVAPSQDQKETTINNALVWLEGALADEYDGVTWTSNAFTVGNNAFTQHMAFKCPDNASASSTLTVPLLRKFFVVSNALGSHQVTVKGATGAAVVVPSAAVAILLCDGTDIFTTTALAATSGVLSVGGASGAIGVTGNIDVTGGTLTLNGMAAESIPAGGAIYSTGTHIAHLALSADFVLAGGSLSLTGVEYTANKNASNGYAGLDSGGKVAFAQLPSSLGDALFFAGTWNANTNSPALASSTDPSPSGAASVYVVTTAGTTTLDTYAQWFAGDKAIFDKLSGKWERIEGEATSVYSVGGASGAIGVTGNLSVVGGTLTLAGMAAQGIPSAGIVYSNGTAVTTLVVTSGVAQSGGTLTLAPIAGGNLLANTGTASAAPVAVPLSSHLTLSGGTLDLVNYGAANGIAGLDASGYVPFAQMQPEVQNLPFGVSHPGTMSDSEVLLVIPVNQTLTIPTGLAGTYVILNDDTADVPAATTALIYASKHAGAWTNRGTLSVSTSGSLTITGGPTADVTLVPGDGVRITGQATHDTGFKNFGVVTMLKKVAG